MPKESGARRGSLAEKLQSAAAKLWWTSSSSPATASTAPEERDPELFKKSDYFTDTFLTECFKVLDTSGDGRIQLLEFVRISAFKDNNGELHF